MAILSFYDAFVVLENVRGNLLLSLFIGGILQEKVANVLKD